MTFDLPFGFNRQFLLLKAVGLVHKAFGPKDRQFPTALCQRRVSARLSPFYPPRITFTSFA